MESRLITRTVTDAFELVDIPEDAVLYAVDGVAVRSSRLWGARFWRRDGDPVPRFGSEVISTFGPLTYTRAATPADVPPRPQAAEYAGCECADVETIKSMLGEAKDSS